ncbi:MAG TPA: ATP-binding protein, partial [Vicinamibacteria bacterium]
ISLAPRPGGGVWARSGSRLLQLSRERLDAAHVADDVPFEEGPIVGNPDGSVWVLSRGGSVRLVSPEGRPVRQLRLPGPLMSAALGPDGALWVGGDGEVVRVGGSGIERWGQAEGVPRGLGRDVVPEPDGAVWIGTYGGGVGRLRAGRVARLTVDQGLPDNSVSRILDDGRGRMWISTNRGLAVVRRSELEAAAEGRYRVMEVVVLGTERGVPEANFGSPAGFAEEGGRLWFGTIAGAVTVDAAAFPFNARPPVVRIEEVRADDRALPVGPTVLVPPLTGRLRLGFTAFAPLYPELMRFRFRVEGTDAEWVDAGAAHTVDWSPPGPGRHRFLVEARYEDGIWSSAPAAVVLDVLPAWWQTTASRVAVALAFALVVAAGVRTRIRGIERRHAARLRALEEQRQAEEKVSSLRAQLEHVSRAALAGELATSLAHEVRQPIGAIVNNAEAVKRNLARYLQRPEELEQVFGEIVADAVRASEVVQGLRGFLKSGGPGAAAVDLSALVRDMLLLVRRELQDNRVEVQLDLAEAVPPVEGLRVQLGQIVVNLVLNACEALAGVEGDRRIAISMAERDGRVELAVRDNGPGLAPEVATRLFEPFVTTKPEGLGVGLAICRSIAEGHGGHLSADTPPGGGFRMTLKLPASSSAVCRS